MDGPKEARVHEVMLSDCYDQLNTCSTVMAAEERTQQILITRMCLARAMGLVQMVRRDLLEYGLTVDDLPF